MIPDSGILIWYVRQMIVESILSRPGPESPGDFSLRLIPHLGARSQANAQLNPNGHYVSLETCNHITETLFSCVSYLQRRLSWVQLQCKMTESVQLYGCPDWGDD